MGKKKVIKVIKIGSYSLGTLGGMYTFANLLLKKKSSDIAQSNDGSLENTIGYDEIEVLNNELVHTNNFVILHVNRNIYTELMKEKIEFCQKNDISIGLVLDTDASNLADIYKDVDFLQAIVREYKIDFPVYCNIDSIMTNGELNVAQRQEIMNAFIDKMSRSDMYFGLYGKDSSLCECKEYVLDTDPYDCFVVKDSDFIKFNGTCSLIEELDGQIIASFDLSKIISEKGLNNSQKLVYSAIYKVKENDTYHSVALKYV